jgi:hypothetical protein
VALLSSQVHTNQNSEAWILGLSEELSEELFEFFVVAITPESWRSTLHLLTGHFLTI